MNWLAIIRWYKTKHFPNHKDETKWFAEQPTLRAAIEQAAMSIIDKNGKRSDHQRRIPIKVLQQAKTTFLHNESSIAACRSFDDLMVLIGSITAPIRGLGELYIYDTALRIGCKLGVRPEKVYLHRGTREGAKRMGYRGNLLYIPMHKLPAPLKALPAAEVEDILCIFKNHLGRNQQEHPTNTNKASCR